MKIKSILKPSESVIAGVATVAAVYAVYQTSVGTVALAQATDANHPALESSRKKSGYTALALVSGLTLVTRDGNIFILGCATIIALEIAYRHAIMANPQSGRMESPNPGALYQPAQNVISFPLQGETA